MAGTAVILPQLKMGSTHPAINELQRLLVKAGLWPVEMLGRVDVNVFGPATLDAVRRIQRDAKLPITGIVDDATWSVLYVQANEPRVVSGGNALFAIPAKASGTSLLAPASSTAPRPAPRPVNPLIPKLLLFGGIAAVAYYAYKKMAKSRGVDGIAFVDDGDDGAGPAIRAKHNVPMLSTAGRLAGSSRKKKPIKRPVLEPSENEGLKTLNPKDKYGRKVWRTKQDEDTWQFEPVDPGPNPGGPYRLEADERMFKMQKRYREDMKTLAWDRARANNHPVDVVVRGTKRVLYSARP